jgi:hypothetical protein
VLRGKGVGNHFLFALTTAEHLVAPPLTANSP